MCGFFPRADTRTPKNPLSLKALIVKKCKDNADFFKQAIASTPLEKLPNELKEIFQPTPTENNK